MGIKTSLFQIDPSVDLELVWQNLEDSGCTLLYSDADENSQKIFGHLPADLDTKDLLAQYPELLTIEAIELPEIDWEGQWSAHDAYHEGYLHVDLQDYAKEAAFKTWSSELKLIPGPGFGDHSHPTTKLVLRLMPSYVIDKRVIDVGCGSGILSLAAVAMGASAVCGIDIDEEALVHSQENAECNGMGGIIKFILPEACEATSGGSVALMNMIQSEQLVAWESLVSIIDTIPETIVTSGILAEGRSKYIEVCTKWGWELVEEFEDDGWLGFVFSNPFT
ncbi:MAG TPA: 50S ribosomal protein L11 methyltransferase [Parachlamydiaceae bacterium]|nr:50S ribosomal protein L11 methyltransferase [Parachlamydiaceae bacterium]